MAKIADIEGIGPKYAAALKDHGIDTTDELLAAGASKKGRADLAAKMAEINEAKNLTNRAPSEKEVEDWVEQAKGLDRVVTH